MLTTGCVDHSKDSKAYDSMPVGTVISSMLPFDKFCEITETGDLTNPKNWNEQKSKWAPCDGRPVPNSKFQTLATNATAPDLRGLFVRGLNSFDRNYTVDPKDKSQLNPLNPQTPGVYELDAFKEHDHGLNSSVLNVGVGGGLQIVNATPKRTYTPRTDFTGDKFETRPKNVSLYYYIRIN